MSEDRRSDRIWRCDDCGHHYVSLTAFDVGSRDQVTYLQIDLQEFAGGWMDRIKTAMRILRYGVYVVGEVLLKEEGLREFQGEIARLVDAESQGKTDNFAPRRKSLDT